MAQKRKIPHAISHDIRVKLKKCKDAKALKRLQAVNMYMRGKTNEEICEFTGFHPQTVTNLVTKVLTDGVSAILSDRRTSNNRRMSFEQETEFLNQFVEMAENGQLVTVQPIFEAFEKATGKPTKTSTIYKLLKRHGWRKLQPRPKHPKSASEEEKNSSKKKLPLVWQKQNL